MSVIIQSDSIMMVAAVGFIYVTVQIHSEVHSVWILSGEVSPAVNMSSLQFLLTVFYRKETEWDILVKPSSKLPHCRSVSDVKLHFSLLNKMLRELRQRDSWCVCLSSRRWCEKSSGPESKHDVLPLTHLQLAVKFMWRIQSKWQNPSLKTVQQQHWVWTEKRCSAHSWQDRTDSDASGQFMDRFSQRLRPPLTRLNLKRTFNVWKRCASILNDQSQRSLEETGRNINIWEYFHLKMSFF